MGRFENLLEGKGQKINIGDYEFTIKALPSKHLGKFMSDTEDLQKQYESMKEIVLVTLQQDDNTVTKEEIEELPVGELLRIMNVINDVNELQ